MIFCPSCDLNSLVEKKGLIEDKYRIWKIYCCKFCGTEIKVPAGIVKK